MSSMAGLEELLRELDLTDNTADMAPPRSQTMRATAQSSTAPINTADGMSSLARELGEDEQQQPATAEDVLAQRNGTIQRMWQQRDQVTADERLASQLQNNEFEQHKHRKDYVAVRQGIQADREMAREAQTEEVINASGTSSTSTGAVTAAAATPAPVAPGLAPAALVDEVAERLRQRLQQQIQTIQQQQQGSVRAQPSGATPAPTSVPPPTTAASTAAAVPAAAAPGAPPAQALNSATTAPAEPQSALPSNRGLTIRRNQGGFYQHGNANRQQAIAAQLAAMMPVDLSDEESETGRPEGLDDEDDDVPVSSPPTAPPPAAAAVRPASGSVGRSGSALVVLPPPLGSVSPGTPPGSSGNLVGSTASVSRPPSAKQLELEQHQRTIETEIREWRTVFRQANGYYPQYKDLLEDKKNMKKRMQAYRDVRRKLISMKGQS